MRNVCLYPDAKDRGPEEVRNVDFVACQAEQRTRIGSVPASPIVQSASARPVTYLPRNASNLSFRGVCFFSTDGNGGLKK
jgi:hypothetical protein